MTTFLTVNDPLNILTTQPTLVKLSHGQFKVTVVCNSNYANEYCPLFNSIKEQEENVNKMLFSHEDKGSLISEVILEGIDIRFYHRFSRDVGVKVWEYLFVPLENLYVFSNVQKPTPPLSRIIREGSVDFCPKCESSMKLSLWFNRKIGCIQPECDNYYQNVKEIKL